MPLDIFFGYLIILGEKFGLMCYLWEVLNGAKFPDDKVKNKFLVF